MNFLYLLGSFGGLYLVHSSQLSFCRPDGQSGKSINCVERWRVSLTATMLSTPFLRSSSPSSVGIDWLSDRSSSKKSSSSSVKSCSASMKSFVSCSRWSFSLSLNRRADNAVPYKTVVRLAGDSLCHSSRFPEPVSLLKTSGEIVDGRTPPGGNKRYEVWSAETDRVWPTFCIWGGDTLPSLTWLVPMLLPSMRSIEKPIDVVDDDVIIDLKSTFELLHVGSTIRWLSTVVTCDDECVRCAEYFLSTSVVQNELFGDDMGDNVVGDDRCSRLWFGVLRWVPVGDLDSGRSMVVLLSSISPAAMTSFNGTRSISRFISQTAAIDYTVPLTADAFEGTFRIRRSLTGCKSHHVSFCTRLYENWIYLNSNDTSPDNCWRQYHCAESDSDLENCSSFVWRSPTNIELITCRLFKRVYIPVLVVSTPNSRGRDTRHCCVQQSSSSALSSHESSTASYTSAWLWLVRSSDQWQRGSSLADETLSVPRWTRCAEEATRRCHLYSGNITESSTPKHVWDTTSTTHSSTQWRRWWRPRRWSDGALLLSRPEMNCRLHVVQ